MTTVLVTGFEPFENERVNPSWEAARRLDGLHLDTAAGPATIAGRCMPCVFGAALEALRAAIAETRPALVIATGYAGGRAELSLERVALNVDDARIADNAGQQPIDTVIVTGGPAAYFTALPIKAILRDLRAAGIPAAVSQTAGTFLCNHIFYGLMHHIAQQEPALRGGFIHVPYSPDQAAHHPGSASMALETMLAGLKIAIATTLAVRQDVVETGGALH